MNKIILSTILAMRFLLYGVNSYADMEQTKDTAAQVEPSSDKKEYGDTTGTVTDIEGDTVTVKDEDDKVHKVDVPDSRTFMSYRLRLWKKVIL